MIIFKETSIYKKIEQLSHQEKTKNKQELRILLEDESEAASFHCYGNIQGLYRLFVSNLS